MSQEQSVIMQTSNALNQCCMGDSKFAGSLEQVECNRLLLVACKYHSYSKWSDKKASAAVDLDQTSYLRAL